jgi:hypothetical protein
MHVLSSRSSSRASGSPDPFVVASATRSACTARAATVASSASWSQCGQRSIRNSGWTGSGSTAGPSSVIRILIAPPGCATAPRA